MSNPTPLFNLPPKQGARTRPQLPLAYPMSPILQNHNGSNSNSNSNSNSQSQHPHQSQHSQQSHSQTQCPYPISSSVHEDPGSPYEHPSPYSMSSILDSNPHASSSQNAYMGSKQSLVAQTHNPFPSQIPSQPQLQKHGVFPTRNNDQVPNLTVNVAAPPTMSLVPTPITTPIVFPAADKKKPRRKPPPIDFTSVAGSASYNESEHSTGSRTSSSMMSGSKPINRGSSGSSLSTTSTSGGFLDTSDLEHNLPSLSPILSPYCDIVRPATTNGSHSNAINLQDSVETPDNSKSDVPEEGLSKRMEEFDTLTSDDWHYIANSGKIIELAKLGEGNGGSVSKCKLTHGNKVFALKLINADPNPDTQKQIIRELQFNQKFKSPYIVKYYGTFIIEKQSMIGITMEYMGGKSLDAIYKRVAEMDPSNRLNEKVLGKIAESILKGLQYLHQQKIIHRDIKPQNILVSSDGCIKICDFGVSGEAVNSLATTFVGTQYYMAPERIEGKPYTVTCDVWSLGLTLLEAASCKFPFGSSGSTNSSGSASQNLGPIELLSLIIESEPKLEDEPEKDIFWSDSFKNFILFCLKKLPTERPSPSQMLTHPWCVHQLSVKVKMDKFIHRIWREEELDGH